MKKVKLFSLAIIIGFSFFSLQAQSNTNGKQNGHGMSTNGMMMDSTAMGCNMMMMHMMKPLAAFSIDDGFIIIMGTKIMKYDKDLNLRKEVEMKIDTAAFKKMMPNCPMMKQGQMRNGSSKQEQKNTR